MAEKLERQLPTGIGGEKLKEGRDTLPAVEVANEVSWVNNKMNLPFELKVGEPSSLGMFLTPDPKTGEKVFNLEVSGSHTRSGILGRVIFSDKEERLYRDVDVKGMGYVWVDDEITVGPVIESYGKISGENSQFGMFKGTTGIANQELIKRDVHFSENFLKAGIRTHGVIAVIELKEIIDRNGKKVTIDEAKKGGILAKEDEPVIEIRAFGVRSRLHDATLALKSDKTRALKLLSDAQNVVAQELGISPKELFFEEYFKWLIETTAINLARMRYNKWISGYLSSHNITLDGRIVDLDSVEIAKDDEGIKDNFLKTFEKDKDQAFDSLADLIFAARESEVLPNEFLTNECGHYGFYKTTYEKELARLKKEKVPKVRN